MFIVHNQTTDNKYTGFHSADEAKHWIINHLDLLDDIVIIKENLGNE